MCVLSAYGTHRVEFFPMKFALVIHLIEWQKSLGTASPSLPATVTLTLSNSLTHTRARSQAREVRARLFRARENREENIKFSQCLPQCVRRRPSSEISSTQNVPMLVVCFGFFPASLCTQLWMPLSDRAILFSLVQRQRVSKYFFWVFLRNLLLRLLSFSAPSSLLLCIMILVMAVVVFRRSSLLRCAVFTSYYLQ